MTAQTTRGSIGPFVGQQQCETIFTLMYPQLQAPQGRVPGPLYQWWGLGLGLSQKTRGLCCIVEIRSPRGQRISRYAIHRNHHRVKRRLQRVSPKVLHPG